jgi:hypothetical protein
MFIPKLSTPGYSESSNAAPKSVSNAQLETYVQKSEEIRKRYFGKLDRASGGTLKLTKTLPQSSPAIAIAQSGSSDQHGERVPSPEVTSPEKAPQSEDEEIFEMDLD